MSQVSATITLSIKHVKHVHIDNTNNGSSITDIVRSWFTGAMCTCHYDYLDRGLAKGQPPLQGFLLTYSMVQSPSWEANWFAASQEIPRISRNPKFHYRTHKRPPTVCILGQPNPVHIPTSHLLEIHPNIIHPSTPRSPKWSLSLWFPTIDNHDV